MSLSNNEYCCKCGRLGHHSSQCTWFDVCMDEHYNENEDKGFMMIMAMIAVLCVISFVASWLYKSLGCFVIGLEFGLIYIYYKFAGVLYE